MHQLRTVPAGTVDVAVVWRAPNRGDSGFSGGAAGIASSRSRTMCRAADDRSRVGVGGGGRLNIVVFTLSDKQLARRLTFTLSLQYSYDVLQLDDTDYGVTAFAVSCSHGVPLFRLFSVYRIVSFPTRCWEFDNTNENSIHDGVVRTTFDRWPVPVDWLSGDINQRHASSGELQMLGCCSCHRQRPRPPVTQPIRRFQAPWQPIITMQSFYVSDDAAGTVAADHWNSVAGYPSYVQTRTDFCGDSIPRAWPVFAGGHRVKAANYTSIVCFWRFEWLTTHRRSQN